MSKTALIAVVCSIISFTTGYLCTPTTQLPPIVIDTPIVTQSVRTEHRQMTNDDLEITSLTVVDGDTVRVDLRWLPPVFGHHLLVRVAGVDTPEIHDKRPEIKERGIAAKDFVQHWADGKPVKLVNPRRDKYFRLLADLMVDGECLAVVLLEKGLAKPYDGGTKSPW